MKTTIVVDTQNAYGSSGDALGQREKPTPAGVVDAFTSVGFDVNEVRIAVALPDAQDCQRAGSELQGQRRGLARLATDLGSLSLPRPIQPQVWACQQRLQSAEGLCVWTPGNGSLRDRMAVLNDIARAVVAELVPADAELRSVVDGLSREARRALGAVSADWVVSMRTLVEASRRLQVVRSAIESVGSFAYAGGANLDYHSSLPATAGSARVKILEGRFRPGRDGQNPGEKQVDTLCAVACVEATTAALGLAEPYAVIVLSDDDDLTPALAHAAELADGSAVRVIVAGTSTVFNRHGESPPAPNRPRWLTLDASMWCRLAGYHPGNIHTQRNQIANLSLGNPGPFTVVDDSPEARTGLKGKLDHRDAGLTGQVVLSAVSLSWGARQDRPVPGIVVGTAGGAIRDVFRARARRAQRSRVGIRFLPLDASGTELEATLGVPGWWMAGDELVVASVQVRGRTIHRVLGHAPGATLPGPPAAALRTEVVAVNKEWAEVTDGTNSWSVYVGRNVGLHSGDQVLVCPYERSGRAGPGGRRFTPRAILLSSAL